MKPCLYEFELMFSGWENRKHTKGDGKNYMNFTGNVQRHGAYLWRRITHFRNTHSLSVSLNVSGCVRFVSV